MRFGVYFLFLSFFFLECFSSFYPSKDLSKEGSVALSNQNYKQAVHFFKEAYKIEKKNPIAIYNLANAYHYNGEFVEATKFYQEAIDLALKNQEKKILFSLYYNLGNTFYKKQDYGKAIENYKLAMDIDENDFPVKKNYELAFQKLEKNKNMDQNNPMSQPKNNGKSENRKNPKEKPKTQNNQEQNSDENHNSPKPTDKPSSNKKDQTQQANSSQENNASGKKSSPTKTSVSNNPISLERAEQILNSYKNRQKRFESHQKYHQNLSTKPNSKNW